MVTAGPTLLFPMQATALVSVLLNLTSAGSTVPAFVTARTFVVGSGPHDRAGAVADLNGDCAGPTPRRGQFHGQHRVVVISTRRLLKHHNGIVFKVSSDICRRRRSCGRCDRRLQRRRSPPTIAVGNFNAGTVSSAVKHDSRQRRSAELLLFNERSRSARTAKVFGSRGL